VSVVRTTLDTRLERALYHLALYEPSLLGTMEASANKHIANSVTAGQRAQELALEFAREQMDREQEAHEL
jgi:hypothetical protein